MSTGRISKKTSENMWEIYDSLIAAVPSELRVTDCLVGISWILVRSEATGMALTMQNGMGPVKNCGSLVGMKVRDLAEYVKSWNSLEAGIGLAAINSAFNTIENVECYSGCKLEKHSQGNAFETYYPELKGKKVSVIGHFPKLEKLRDWCSLTILERCPQQGDLPDPACEYVLPDQDYVFITAATLINKTLPRLLELSKKAKVILVGPSTPLHPLLFSMGIEGLAGSVLQNEVLWRYVREGGLGPGIFKQGCQMVRIDKEDRDGR
jgi:uncharacterized protein (DUF4213/DUF364 family)